MDIPACALPRRSYTVLKSVDIITYVMYKACMGKKSIRFKLKYIQIALEPELYEEVRLKAFENDTSISKIIRVAIKEAFNIETPYHKDFELKEELFMKNAP